MYKNKKPPKGGLINGIIKRNISRKKKLYEVIRVYKNKRIPY